LYIFYFSRHILDALLDIAYDYSQTGGDTVIHEKMTATLAKLAEAEKTTLEALIGFLRSVAQKTTQVFLTTDEINDSGYFFQLPALFNGQSRR